MANKPILKQMKNFTIILTAMAITFFSCQNEKNEKNEAVDEAENVELTSPEDSDRESTIKADEKMIVYVEASDAWFENQQEKYQNKADSANKIITDKFVQAVNLAKEKGYKVVKDYNHFNIMFKTKNESIDLRLEELSATGYKLVLINPNNKFDVLGVNDLDNFNEKFGEVFEL